MTLDTITKKKRSLVLPIAVGIVVLAVGGFIASRAGLDKALVKQQVDNFIVTAKEKGRAQGRDIEITYGELEVAGGLTSKHVIIHQPVLTVKPLERKPQVPGQRAKTDSLIVSTPSLAIYPQAADLSSLRVEAAQPINIAGEEQPDKSLLSITSATPQVMKFSKQSIEGVSYNDVAYESPASMELTYLREEQAKGAEEATPSIVPVYDTIALSMKPGGGFLSSIAEDGSNLGSSKMDFSEIIVTPKSAPEGAVKIAALVAEWANRLNESKRNLITAKVTLGPITSDNAAAPYLPVSLALDGSYEGAILKSPESIAEAEAQQSFIKLATLSLSTKDASLSANADFTATPTDMLPVGTANVTLTNTQYVMAELRKVGILNPSNETMVTTLLERVTGIPVAQQKDTTIAIARQRGGAFKIGQTTFEEVFAIVLQQAMQNKAIASPAPSAPASDALSPAAGPGKPLAPELPPADKPKAAPIAVPDNGVRG